MTIIYIISKRLQCQCDRGCERVFLKFILNYSHVHPSCPCRRNRLQAEGISGMHQSVNYKRDEPWPGGTRQNDPGGERGVSGSLQQPEPTVPQPRAVYRAEQRIRVRLHTLGVRRTALSDRCVIITPLTVYNPHKNAKTLLLYSRSPAKSFPIPK